MYRFGEEQEPNRLTELLRPLPLSLHSKVERTSLEMNLNLALDLLLLFFGPLVIVVSGGVVSGGGSGHPAFAGGPAVAGQLSAPFGTPSLSESGQPPAVPL